MQLKYNIIQYLKEYGGKSFRESPFSEVDALVLSQMSYLKMDGIVPGFGKGRGVSLEEMSSHPDAEKMFTDPLYGKQHKRVFRLVAGSRRYHPVKVNYYKAWFDEEREAQFAAVTFFLGSTSIFVSFRGTDETLVGWKEDFNMGYMKVVPSQRSALAYLKGVARYTQGRIVIGGHSKGGNLAIYASSYAPPQIQSRIRRVYSFDGPGFQRGFYDREGFIRIEDRFCKIVPAQSLIGMILTNYRKYRVVESYGVGMGQHDLMQWKIKDGKFIYRKEIQGRSSKKSVIFNNWINSLSKQQAVVFVETLYGLLRQAQISNVAQLLKKPFHILHTALRFFKNLDKKKRNMFFQTIGKFFSVMRETLFGHNRRSKRDR